MGAVDSGPDAGGDAGHARCHPVDAGRAIPQEGFEDLDAGVLCFGCHDGGNCGPCYAWEGQHQTSLECRHAHQSGPFEQCLPTVDAGGHMVQVRDYDVLGTSTRVRVLRLIGEGPVIGISFAFELVGYAHEKDGQVTCVTDLAALSYTYSHHNSDDHATVLHDGQRHLLNLSDFTFGGGPDGGGNALEIRDAISNAVLEGPLPLTRMSCVHLGTDQGCFW